MFLLPIVFFPMTIDAFGIGKNLLIMMLVLVGLVIWSIEILINKKEQIKVNKMWWLMLGVVLWAWVLWYRMPAGVRIRSLTDLTGVGMLTAGLAGLFLWLQVTSEEERKKQLNWLTAAGLLAAITSVIIFLIPSAKLPINFPKDDSIISINAAWSITGSILSELILFLFLILEWGKTLMVKLRKSTGDSGYNYLGEALIVSFFTLVLFLDFFKIYKTGWINMDGTTGWVIAVETFKQSPIWGVGAGNFIEAFNRFRPNSYNLTAMWANSFVHSSSGVLNLWTELGVVGLGLAVIALMGLLRIKKNYDFGVMMVIVVSGIFLPLNFVGMMLLVWIVSSMTADSKKINLQLKLGSGDLNVAPAMLIVIVMGMSVFGGYWIYKMSMADIYMRKSLSLAAKNDGGGTYNLQIKAIGMNSFSAEYRNMYSQTNLALASSLLVNKDISDEDKQKASTLIQQSVREAKAAAALDGNNPIHWSNLASIYRQLAGVVDGSADWSFQAYQQAIVLDPANPVTKLNLGGLLFAANRFDEADRIFEQVVTVKPNFANAWYNWAYSAKKMNKLDYAVQRLTQAVALVPADSGDFEKANAELTTWKKELDELNKKQAASAQESVEPKQPETLKTPDALPTTTDKEQVVIPTGGELAPVVPTVSL